MPAATPLFVRVPADPPPPLQSTTCKEYWFGHEKLDVYRLARAVAKWAGGEVTIPPARKHLRDQLVRAADSMVLNIAEGAGHPAGDQRRHHYRVAAGSAAEVASILDLVEPPGAAERIAELRRVGAMLAQMTR